MNKGTCGCNIIGQIVQKFTECRILSFDDYNNLELFAKQGAITKLEGNHSVSFVELSNSSNDENQRILLNISNERTLEDCELLMEQTQSLLAYPTTNTVNIPQIYAVGIYDHAFNNCNAGTVIIQQYIADAEPLRERVDAQYSISQLNNTINMKTSTIQKLFADARAMILKGICPDLVFPGNNILQNKQGNLFFIDNHYGEAYRCDYGTLYKKLIYALVGPKNTLNLSKYLEACEHVRDSISQMNTSQTNKNHLNYACKATGLGLIL